MAAPARLTQRTVRPPNSRRIITVAGIGLSVLALVACATRQSASVSSPRDPVEEAVEQPLKDLGLIQVTTPDVLIQALVAPYASNPDMTCAELREQVMQLTVLIGPDLDAPRAKKPTEAEGLLGSLLHGAVSLPYRGILRRLTGAESREQAYQRAVTAAVARRGYLRGLMRANACEALPVAQTAGDLEPVF